MQYGTGTPSIPNLEKAEHDLVILQTRLQQPTVLKILFDGKGAVNVIVYAREPGSCVSIKFEWLRCAKIDHNLQPIGGFGQMFKQCKAYGRVGVDEDFNHATQIIFSYQSQCRKPAMDTSCTKRWSRSSYTEVTQVMINSRQRFSEVNGGYSYSRGDNIDANSNLALLRGMNRQLAAVLTAGHSMVQGSALWSFTRAQGTIIRRIRENLGSH